MADFERGLHEAMARLLASCGFIDVTVTGFEQYEATGGNCETCRWSEIRVGIDFVTAAGDTDRFDYHGDMAKLIRVLTNEVGKVPRDR